MNIVPATNKLSLKNKGHLSVFFVGTGSAFTKTMYQNNILIIKGNHHLLIDCGASCFRSLHQVGVSSTDIDNVLITHSHADHIGGLEELMMMGRYLSKKTPNLIISEEYEPFLWNESLKGGSAYSEIVDNRTLRLRDFVNIQRPRLIDSEFREMMEVNVDSINIKMIRTKHFPDNAKSWRDSHFSYGIIIDDSVFFTSDTRFDKSLLDEVTDRFSIEIIFHDCQLFNGGIHASLDELLDLPQDLKQKIVLMHYSDNWKDFEQKGIEGGFHSWAKQHYLYNFKPNKKKFLFF